MSKREEQDKEDALMRQFSLLREDAPEDLHARIVQVATAMPQRKVAETVPQAGWTAWLATLLPDMRMGMAFACTVLALVALLGVHVGQLQQTAPQGEEDAAVIFSMIDGNIGWEEWS